VKELTFFRSPTVLRPFFCSPGSGQGSFGALLGSVAHPTLSFLPWNLFLAWIPFGLAVSAQYLSRQGKSATALGSLSLLWLLFFPNAPYIVTDFVHVETSSTLRALLDFGPICAFAVTGLVLGYASLVRVHALVQARLGVLTGWLIALGSLIVSGVGINLGRMHQLNSWDVLVRPGHVLATTMSALADPLAHVGAFAASTSAGAVLAVSYFLACRVWSR